MNSRSFAARLASSSLFARARKLAEENRADWNFSLGRFENLLVSLYLLLRDYADGSLPLEAANREQVYESERQYGQGLGNVSREEFLAKEMRKPFWDAQGAGKYLEGFVRLLRVLESLGIRPPSRLLELGCGSGWMAEFFAITGYRVVATTLTRSDGEAVAKRIAAVRAKGLTGEFDFELSAMEKVDKVVAAESFDAVYVHQALHHAHDWRATLQAAFRMLKPRGWMIIADEPNVLHTFINYRMGKMSGLREIGMRRGEIVRCLREVGYQDVRVISPRFNDRLHPHWIAAQK